MLGNAGYNGGADAGGYSRNKAPFVQLAKCRLVQNNIYNTQLKSVCQCCRCTVRRQIPNDQNADAGDRELCAKENRYVNVWSQRIKKTRKYSVF